MDPGATHAAAEPYDPELRARAAEFAHQISLIMAGLLAVLNNLLNDLPLPDSLVAPLSRHLTRAGLRFERLLARIAAGPAATARRRAGKPQSRTTARATPLPDWFARLFGAQSSGAPWQPDDLRDLLGRAGFPAAPLPRPANPANPDAAADPQIPNPPAVPPPAPQRHQAGARPPTRQDAPALARARCRSTPRLPCPGWPHRGQPDRPVPRLLFASVRPVFPSHDLNVAF